MKTYSQAKKALPAAATATTLGLLVAAIVFYGLGQLVATGQETRDELDAWAYSSPEPNNNLSFLREEFSGIFHDYDTIAATEVAPLEFTGPIEPCPCPFCCRAL